MLQWLPPLPSNFRDALRAATEAPDRLERLASLSGHRLGFLETIQLDRAIGPIEAEARPGFAVVRLAVAGSATLDHLVPGIRVAGLRRRLLIDLNVGAYGQYRAELIDPNARLRAFRPKAILLSLTAQDVLGSVPLGVSVEDARAAVNRAIEDLRGLWRKARGEIGATVLQQTFIDTTHPVFGGHDRIVPGAPTRLIAHLNDAISEAAAADGVLIVDAARWSARDGLDSWFDIARWLQAKQEIAPQVAPLYGDLVVRILAAERGLSRKCLVLDLDNTLWGGTAGDDGLEGIVLGQGSAAGEAHLALQLYAKQLRERGVILAVCSKNDPAIAEAAFSHPEMALKRSDITAFIANWNDKADNLRIIANQLNVGVDSLVFVDDNPVERARIREALPAVAVPEMPEDPAQYVRCLADAGYFEAVGFTLEDRERAAQYSADAERNALQTHSGSIGDFLAGLGMSVRFGRITKLDLPRVTQLINKTNQFNPTTRRYTQDEITRFVDELGCITLRFRLVDRFGDNGLVSAMILRSVEGEPDAREIDCWVMSCRVFGRELEHEAMNIAVEVARCAGVRKLQADYAPTAKNGVVADLYGRLGFSRILDLSNGGTRWSLTLDSYAPAQTHITRVEDET
ncbi:MAG TPA: HAD-IIIC family phosphatase [Alphaproteobacteria bacterium]|nr:HAD-IIIC family phosphatase [Alphaproteobacteria bacterium]